MHTCHHLLVDAQQHLAYNLSMSTVAGEFMYTATEMHTLFARLPSLTYIVCDAACKIKTAQSV